MILKYDAYYICIYSSFTIFVLLELKIFSCNNVYFETWLVRLRYAYV